MSIGFIIDCLFVLCRRLLFLHSRLSATSWIFRRLKMKFFLC